MKKIYLVTEDGKSFEGYSFGAELETCGELVFNTSMVGYIETLTDAAYHGQIVVETFPLVGNYGIISADFEGKCAPKGFIVREWCDAPSNFRCEYDLDKYLKDIVVEGYENGFVSTLYGRRRYIPELSGQNKMLKKFGERVAMNSPIQGTAADIIKVAMINVSRRLEKEGIDARLILQVHDELIVEANKSCAEQASTILREEMENAINLPVPLSVELTVGETWYDNK